MAPNFIKTLSFYRRFSNNNLDFINTRSTFISKFKTYKVQ